MSYTCMSLMVSTVQCLMLWLILCVTSMPSAESGGCIEDIRVGTAVDQRAMKFLGSSNSMTMAKCAALARSNNFDVLGIQYSSYCYGVLASQLATDDRLFPRLDPSRCNMKCSGDSTQTCGGGYAYSTYYLDGEHSCTNGCECVGVPASVDSPMCGT